tara:strand:+ start:333 stop:743 length:411 start_codon:yes stop_codon:yes gene_type:complete
MSGPIEKGMIVAITGGTVDRSGKFIPSVQVCKAIEIGSEDVLVCDFPRKSFSRIFKVSKSICVPISVSKDTILSSKTTDPKIGDLVLTYSTRFGEDKEMNTGILFSITYSEGKPFKCKILSGETFIDSLYDELIVI